MTRSGLIIAFAFALAATVAAPLEAAEITKEECDALRAETAALAAAGVPKLMERGAEWAKANLSAADLDKIRRLIHASEQITFRCETVRPLNAKIERSGENDGVDTVDGAAPSDVAKPAETTLPAAAAPPPKSKTPAQSKSEPKAGAAKVEAPPPSKSSSAAPRPLPKPAPKPKANDAYVPPADAASTLDDQAARRP